MRLKTNKMLLASLFCAITAICAQIVIAIPTTQVQISMSTFAVFLCGSILYTKYSAISMLVYIMLGGLGIPVFGKFAAGLGILLGPTGGYIISYPLMTIAIGIIVSKKQNPRFITLFSSMLLSLVICYTFGSIWLSIVSNISFSHAIAMGVLPFITFDIIKAAFAAYFSIFITNRMKIKLF